MFWNIVYNTFIFIRRVSSIIALTILTLLAWGLAEKKERERERDRESIRCLIHIGIVRKELA